MIAIQRIGTGLWASEMSEWKRSYRPSSRKLEGPIGSATARSPKALTLEIPLQLVGSLVGASLQVERRDKTAVAVHQIDQGGVVHRIVAVLERDLLGINPVFGDHLGHHLGIADKTLKKQNKARQIFLHGGRRGARGIDRDEIRFHAVGL